MNVPLEPPAREPVIEALVNLAFDAMLPLSKQATATEVVSAAFAICERVVRSLLKTQPPSARERNIEVLRTAIGHLYEKLPAPENVN